MEETIELIKEIYEVIDEAELVDTRLVDQLDKLSDLVHEFGKKLPRGLFEDLDQIIVASIEAGIYTGNTALSSHVKGRLSPVRNLEKGRNRRSALKRTYFDIVVQRSYEIEHEYPTKQKRAAAISEWLEAKFGVTVNPHTVRNWLKEPSGK